MTDIIAEFIPKEKLLDPAEIFTQYIYNDMRNSDILNPSDNAGTENFFVSANKEAFIDNSKLFYEVTECKQL